MNIGAKIKEYRKKKKITQRQLAAAINKSKSTIEKYETNTLKNIPITTLNEIAKVLDVSLNDLYESNYDSTSNNTPDKYSNITVSREVLLFAFRYSLGRETYAPYVVTKAIKDNIKNITDEDINLYIKEILECSMYGADMDKEHWLDFAEYLKGILRERGFQA